MKSQERSAYFAQYYGQRVFRNSITSPLETVSFPPYVEHITAYITLKSLADISDEDAIEVAKIQSWRRGFNQDVNNFKQIVIYMGEGTIGMPFEIADFLRSRSYALPFRQYSVEQLIEAGVLRLEMKGERG